LGRGAETEDVHLFAIKFSKGTAIIMENGWILSFDNPMTYDSKPEFVGDKGPIQADPAHKGAVRRLTGNSLKYSDLLGITAAGESWIAGLVPVASLRCVAALPGGAPLLDDREDGLATTHVLAVLERSAASGQAVALCERIEVANIEDAN
jgi:hypothetical protein